ncbi:hypothetical protein MWK40_00040 [Escherichia coli]|nr:hypothetical protein [Escherichia coli]
MLNAAKRTGRTNQMAADKPFCNLHEPSRARKKSHCNVPKLQNWPIVTAWLIAATSKSLTCFVGYQPLPAVNTKLSVCRRDQQGNATVNQRIICINFSAFSSYISGDE